MNETSPQDKNLEELLKSKPANPTTQTSDTAYVTAQPIDKEEIKQKKRDERDHNRAYTNKKQIVAGRITMAITAFIFVIVLAVSFFRCGNSDCRTGGFEVLLLAPIFCLFFLAGLITVIVNTVLYNARKNKSEKIDSGISQSPQPVHAEKSSASIFFKGAGGILAIIGVIIMYYAILVGGNNIIPMLIAVSLFLVAALLVSIGHNKDK